MFKTILASALIASAIVGAYFLGIKEGRDAEFMDIMRKINPDKVTNYARRYENSIAEQMMKMANKMLDWISEEE